MRQRERPDEAPAEVPAELLAFRDGDWPHTRQLDRMAAWSDARVRWEAVTGRELPEAPPLPDAAFDSETDV